MPRRRLSAIIILRLEPAIGGRYCPTISNATVIADYGSHAIWYFINCPINQNANIIKNRTTMGRKTE
jgi:hypothetical protein